MNGKQYLPMMMAINRLLLILLIFFFNNTKSKTLNEVLDFEYQFILPSDCNPALDKYYYDGNLLYLIKSTISNYSDNKLKLELVTINTSQKIRNYNLFIPNNLFDINKKNHFGVNFIKTHDNYLFISYSTKLLTFQKSNNGFIFLKCFEYYKKVTSYFPDIDFAIGQSTSKKLNLSDTVVNLESHLYSISNNTTVFYDDPSGLKWLGMLPKKIIDHKNDETLVSDLDRYKIRFYKDGILHDSLSRNLSFWFTANDSLIGKKISYCQQYENIIHDVSFLGDEFIMVKWSKPPQTKKAFNYDLFYDIWQKDSSNYKLTQSDLTDFTSTNLKNRSQEIFSPDLIDLFEITCNDKYLLSIAKLPEPIETYETLTFDDYQRLVNKFYVENEPKFSVIVWSIKK